MRKIVLPLVWALTTFPLVDATAHGSEAHRQGDHFQSGDAEEGHRKPSRTPQMRTYVSGVGKDSNPCTASSPCQTFQAAMALTVAGGEIYVLDSANYGAVTINKAVSITSEGAMAGVLATSGAGITITAGAGDVINLRGLDIDGGGSGVIGIQFSSGQSLNIQKSAVRNFTNSGISFSPNGPGTLFITETTVTNSANNGISITSNGTAVTSAINRVTASGNGTGILAYGGNASVTIIDTVAGNNSYGIGASSSAVMVRNSTVSNNGVGIAADQNAIIRVGQSTVAANGTGWQATNGGQVLSYSNNNVAGNTTDGTVTSTVALQ
jgi:parallel beta helix pectate lyase-like protein